MKIGKSNHKIGVVIFSILAAAAVILYFGVQSNADLMPYLKVVKINKNVQIHPLSKVWGNAPSITVPLNIQNYSIKKVQLKAIISGKYVYIRLKWFDPTKNDKIYGPDQFYDGCAVSFPVKKQKGYAPSVCMGQIGNEVNIWHWRANMKNHYAANLIAGGAGTLTEDQDPSLHQDAVWSDGKWYVEFYKPLNDTNSVSFMPNKKYYMAIAVWDGSDHERAMMKSVSNWLEVKTQ